MQLFREFQPEDEKESFELQLALCNSHGEEGDVAAVRAQLAGYMEKYKDIPNAVAFYYIALLKAYRRASASPVRGGDVLSVYCILQCLPLIGAMLGRSDGYRDKPDP